MSRIYGVKTIPSSGSEHRLTKVCVFLLTVALIAGMIGCDNDGNSNDKSYALAIASTAGGSVTTPGEGEFTYNEGAVVSLLAEAEPGYRFVNWAGDFDTIPNIEAPATSITMNDNCWISANFIPETSEYAAIRDWYDLDAVRDNLAGNYTLMNDLDSTTAGYEELASPTANGDKGWQPIGAWGARFTGSLDGQGHEIRDLFIAQPDEGHVGLFVFIDDTGVVRSVGVVNADVLSCGSGRVGILAGSNRGTLLNCYSTGNVSGGQWVGGLVGINDGWPDLAPTWNGNVIHCHSTAAVSGNQSGIGGLVGNNDAGTLSRCYTTGSVIGYGWVGGLAGVSGGSIRDCYSVGNVTGDRLVGGLSGGNGNFGTVSNSYSTGNVTGDEYVGGLLGNNDGAVSNSFWDTQTSGQSSSAGGTGKTTVQMQDITTFSGAGWDITAVVNSGTRNPAYIWNIVDGASYPFLSWQP